SYRLPENKSEGDVSREQRFILREEDRRRWIRATPVKALTIQHRRRRKLPALRNQVVAKLVEPLAQGRQHEAGDIRLRVAVHIVEIHPHLEGAVDQSPV